MTRLSNPILSINNQVEEYAPETLTVESLGLGENIVQVVTTGGGNTDIVIGDKIDTRISKIKFQKYNRPGDLDRVRLLKNNRENNLIAIQNGDTSVVFRKCTLVNDPSLGLESDGMIELMFEGLTVE